jgi:PTS system nitrogen regulatory IIA component
VRGSDPYKTIAEVTADYDILIIGAPPESTLKTLFFGSREHRAAAHATCSVLKVKAPRHQVHHRFEMHREDAQEQMILSPHIHHAIVRNKISVPRKADLFRTVGRELLAAGHCNNTEEVVSALEEREQRQNTALREGIAISAPTVEGLSHTQVVVLTLDRAIDYQSSSRPMVDVVILVLAPRSDRQTQLWVLERLARMALRSDLLVQLRQANSEEEIRAAILDTVQQEQF